MVNNYECTKTYQEGQCKTIQITANVDETLEVTFTDDRGCSTVLIVEISVDNTTHVHVPNIFSPNGDGINDVFGITSNFPDITVNRFIIYDRWGNNVFSQHNKLLSDLDSWNGLYGNKEVSEGVYMYLFSITAKDGSSIIKAGDITIIR